MEIKFEQQGLLYVAEFEVASNCNLHIERESRGAFTIAQRGTKQGKYAYITDENYDSRTTIDVDMLGNLYPKYIRVTSVSKPTMAEVNFGEESGGSGDGEDIVYYRATVDYIEKIADDIGLLASLFKVMSTDYGILIGPLAIVGSYINETGSNILGIKLNYSNFVRLPGNENTINLETILNSQGITRSMLQPYVITKEEFYTI
jgi:hypothetical protein